MADTYHKDDRFYDHQFKNWIVCFFSVLTDCPKPIGKAQ